MQKLISKYKLQKSYRPTAAIILTNSKNQFLVVRSAKDENAWYFPQGGIKDAENLPSAIKRELREELSICFDEYKIDNPSILHKQLNFDHPTKREYKNGKAYFFVSAKYIGNGNIIPKRDEISEFRWVAKDECVNLFSKGPNSKFEILQESLQHC